MTTNQKEPTVTALDKSQIATIKAWLDSLHYVTPGLRYPEAATPLPGMLGATFDLVHSRTAHLSLYLPRERT